MPDGQEDLEKITQRDFDAIVRQNQQRRVYRRKPKRAADLVSHIITKRGLAAQQSSRKLQDLWDASVDMEIANNTIVGSIKRGQLEVVVSNSSMLQALSFQKHDILKKIQSQMADIKNLRFRIGRIS